MRQSLFLNPQLGNALRSPNSVWGFYADGFFDRRMPGVSHNNIANSTVAAGTNQVAYIGSLLFNPTTGYHLFFPAAGHRGITGVPVSLGGSALYFSGTQLDEINTWCLELTRVGGATIDYVWRSDGLSIRCVAE
jgi:hypothetical protein